MKNPFYESWNKYRKKVNSEDNRQRSFGEQFFLVYVSFMFILWIIHGLSFGAAVAWPAHIASLLFGGFVVGLVVGSFFLLLLIEIPKYVCVNVFFENFYKSGKTISYGIGLAGLGFICVSIALSTYSVERAMTLFSSEVVLEDLDKIEAKFSTKLKDAREYWQPQVDTAIANKKAFKKENEKFYPDENRVRLSSSKYIQRPYNKLIAEVNRVTQERDQEIKDIKAERKAELAEARSNNKDKTASHESELFQASSVGFWFMLVLEIFYLLLIAFKWYYKDRSQNEHDQTEDEETETDQGGDNPTKGAKVVSIDGREGSKTDADQGEHETDLDPSDPNPRVHGKPYFVKGATVARVSYQKKDGSFTSYTASEFEAMAKRKKTSERQAKIYRQLAEVANRHVRKTS